ncbi:probable protein phosphatase 2C 19 [Panicum virgatum]|uniref:probable protein phosphatase 2C 19 n=1 Tax=Panicum virgatum TaxID=38727 RepID=UPI0019D64F1D|nr:probable protein phosphatase 2C 19 [Panicum virgatum]
MAEGPEKGGQRKASPKVAPTRQQERRGPLHARDDARPPSNLSEAPSITATRAPRGRPAPAATRGRSPAVCPSGGDGAWGARQKPRGLASCVGERRIRCTQTLPGDGPEGYKTPRGKQAIPMGASTSREGPLLLKFSEGGENARIKYAVSSVQDRRKNKKDDFAAVPDLDDLTSFFGVYDGHEGTEVALLCVTQLHTELRNHPDYQQDLANAMRMSFFRMDELLEQSDEWKELLLHDTCGPVHCHS